MANIFNKISSIDTEDDVPEITSRIAPTIVQARDEPKYQRPDQDVPDFLVKSVEITPSESVDNTPDFKWVNTCIAAAAIIWIITASIIAYSFFDLGSGLSKFTTVQWAGLCLFAGGPILMLLVTGYALKQLARVSMQAHHLSRSVQDILSPDETAIGRTAVMSHKIKSEITDVNARVDGAISRVATLQDTLEAQLEAIDRSSYITENKTELIANRMKEEREALSSIASTFDQRMGALSGILDAHTDKLSKSTQDAEQRIQEARISVESAAAKINTASELVRENTMEAASKLSANQDEIQRLGMELSLRAHELDHVYSKHANDLAAMISNLRQEQETLGSTLEAQLEKMRDMSLAAQVSSKHLTDASTSGRQTVEALANAARLTETAVKKRFSEMEDMVKYSNTRAESISEKAARRVQESLGQTRKEIARIEYDMIALQERLSDRNAMELHASDEVETAPPSNAVRELSSSSKPKGIAGLRPLPDDETAADIPSRVATGEPKPTAPVHDQEQSPKKRLSGLRPAPQPDEAFSPTRLEALLDPVTEAQHDLEIPDVDKPLPILRVKTPIVIPEPEAQSLFKEPNVTAASVHQHDRQHSELILEIPIEADLNEPDPDQEILQFTPDMLRPIGGDEKRRKKSPSPEKDRRSWWRNLLPGGGAPETSAIDQLTAAKVQNAAVSDAEIIETLSNLGLSPAAIVDDGCIIEAANTRISRGPLAMSDVITHRLEDPIRHLYSAVQSDPQLKSNLSNFARRFHTALGEIEDNREAIRGRLESDTGRAFLLCDAALNR